MELHKRRKALTEPEVRYLMQQTLLAVDHLHRTNIIHRDIKLGNLFLNDEMWIKIGDFGLATKVEHDGERKRWVEFGGGAAVPGVSECRRHSPSQDTVWHPQLHCS